MLLMSKAADWKLNGQGIVFSADPRESVYLDVQGTVAQCCQLVGGTTHITPTTAAHEATNPADANSQQRGCSEDISRLQKWESGNPTIDSQYDHAQQDPAKQAKPSCDPVLVTRHLNIIRANDAEEFC